MSAFPHYFKALPLGCTHIDVYRVLSLFEVSDPALQHAVKKLLCAGARGAKDQAQDIAEAIATLQRWQQMREEEQPDSVALRETQKMMGEINARARELFANLPEGATLADAIKHLRAESDLLATGGLCKCRERQATECPGQWEPGCDLGANEAHAVPAPPEAALALREAIQTAPEDAERRFGPITSDPADAERNIRAKEDDERAAYLERWRNAPEWAGFAVQYFNGHCEWFEMRPVERSHGLWAVMQNPSGRNKMANFGMLGSVRCEPRPVQGVGP